MLIEDTPDFITEELADETSNTVDELFGNPQGIPPPCFDSHCMIVSMPYCIELRKLTCPLDWTEVTYKPKLLQLVARVSSRVFIGPELCANEEWLDITQKYAVDSFIAVRALREWRSILRPTVHWFLPECRTLRATLAEARRIIGPVIQERRASSQKARAAGKDASKMVDTVGWMDDASEGQPYDSATVQLGLSFAAIHTTTEMVSGLINDICANPKYFEPLGQEISSVIGSQGWSKQSLHRLELLDSAMKKSQRHHSGDICENPNDHHPRTS